MGAALHILCSRESETPSVFAESFWAWRTVTLRSVFRFTGGVAASNTETFVLKSDEAHIVVAGLQDR